MPKIDTLDTLPDIYISIKEVDEEIAVNERGVNLEGLRSLTWSAWYNLVKSIDATKPAVTSLRNNFVYHEGMEKK